MATLTIIKAPYKTFGGLRIVAGKIDFDSSYPTGGETISLPLNEVWGVVIENKSGYMFEYDRINNKVKAFTPTVAQAAHAHNLVFKANAAANAVSVAANSLRNASAGDLTVTGGGADGGIATSGAIAAAAASEVANATNLSALTGVAFIAWGY